MVRMIFVVERRIPERHDAIAHVFVDGALSIEDHVGHRREESIDQRGESLRIPLELFGDRGESSDIREKQGHFPHLATEHQPFRLIGELLDKGRGEILAESAADLPLLGFGAQEVEQGGAQINQQNDGRRVDRVEQPVLFREQVPRECDGPANGHDSDNGTPQCSEPGQHYNKRSAKDEDVDDFRSERPIRSLDVVIEKHLFQRLHMNQGAGRDRVDRCRLNVPQTRGTGADDDHVSFDSRVIDIRGKQMPRRNRTLGRICREVQPHTAIPIGRHDDAADLHVIDTCLLAVSRLPARTR